MADATSSSSPPPPPPKTGDAPPPPPPGGTGSLSPAPPPPVPPPPQAPNSPTSRDPLLSVKDPPPHPPESKGPPLSRAVSESTETRVSSDTQRPSRPGSRHEQRQKSASGRFLKGDVKIGEGAFKQVFVGFDTIEGKEVAWSEIKLEGLKALDKSRVQQEAALLTRLKHKNILVMYETWQDEERQMLFLITSRGAKTLKENVGHLHPLQPAMIKKMCRQILSSLVYLHSGIPEVEGGPKKPIIHRDLKCDNIFIDGPTGNVKVGDFGLAEAFVAPEDGKHNPASMEGTLGFTAPELLREDPYNERVDIYAFGMCVLEMATNEYPFGECGKNVMSLLAKVAQNEKPASLERVDDPALKRFIEQCLLPADQRPSAKELLENTYYPLNDQKLKVKAWPNTSQDTTTLQVSLRLCLDGVRKKIQFSYDVTKDTPAAIAREFQDAVLGDRHSPGLEAEIIGKLSDTVKPATQKLRHLQMVELLTKLELPMSLLDALARENVTIVDLPYLKEEDYDRLGIALGPRRRIQQHLVVSPPPSPAGFPLPTPTAASMSAASMSCSSTSSSSSSSSSASASHSVHHPPRSVTSPTLTSQPAIVIVPPFPGSPEVPPTPHSKRAPPPPSPPAMDDLPPTTRLASDSQSVPDLKPPPAPPKK